MSEIDPLALVYIEACNGGVTDYDEHIRGLRAVAAAVREQVAQEIEADAIPVTTFHNLTQTAHNRALEHAARIARGGDE